MFNLAIVGLGRWGQRLVDSVQGPLTSPSSKVKFTHGVVRETHRSSLFAEARGLDLSTDYDAILRKSTVDGVVLATPHLQHEEQILAAAEAGKHVFVEKPLTLCTESARRIAFTCRQRDITLAIGHNRRFLPALNYVRELIADHKLGEFLHIEGNMSGNFALSYSPDNWRSSPQESPLGGMTAMGIHLIDAFLYLVGRISAVSTLSARTAVSIEIDDTTSLLVKFASGGTGYLGTVYATAPTFRIQVFGTAGSAHLLDRDTVIITHINGHQDKIDFDHRDIERAELEAFAEAAIHRIDYPVTLDDGVHGVAVMEAAIRASESGERFEPVRETLGPDPLDSRERRTTGA